VKLWSSTTSSKKKRTNKKKTLSERSITLSSQCASFLGSSGLPLATIVNQDKKQIADCTEEEKGKITELRVMCLERSCNGWSNKVPDSCTQKIFGPHYLRCHPELANCDLKALFDTVQNSSVLDFGDGVLSISEASRCGTPPPLLEPPPPTLETPTPAELTADLWRWLTTIPTRRLEIHNDVRNALKPFFAEYPRHSPSAVLARRKQDSMTRHFTVLAAVAQTVAIAPVTEQVIELVLTTTKILKKQGDKQRRVKFSHEFDGTSLINVRGSWLDARRAFRAKVDASDFKGDLTLLSDGVIVMQHTYTDDAKEPDKKKQKKKKKSTTTTLVPTQASTAAASWAAKNRPSATPADDVSRTAPNDPPFQGIPPAGSGV
jgi:hypothetical protein